MSIVPREGPGVDGPLAAGGIVFNALTGPPPR
jgi:hypothetical protein